MVKRSIAEDESLALVDAIDALVDRGARLVTSSLGVVEVTRIVRRRLEADDPLEIAALVEQALLGVIVYPVNAQVVDVARRLGPATLRTLDAIHLASATLIGAETMCSYDRRLLAAAAEFGFRADAPGVDR